MTDVSIEILAEIVSQGRAPKRLLGRDADGAWCLIDELGTGERRIVSEMVTLESAYAVALAILAGDDRTITRSSARTTMAVAIVTLCFLAERGVAPAAPADPPPSAGAEPLPSRAAMPGPTGDAAAPDPAAFATLPDANPVASGGDLFGGSAS